MYNTLQLHDFTP